MSNTTYYIEIRQKPLTDLVTARCLAARKQATSVTGHMVAVHACAKKIAHGSQYTLCEFNRYTWLCTVSDTEVLQTAGMPTAGKETASS